MFHLESDALSAASGCFPPSHRYKIEYLPRRKTVRPLRPPLLINPRDQNEIHFELDLFPKSVVSGCGACLLFLHARHESGLQARLPLVHPHPGYKLIAKTLKKPIVVPLVASWDLRRPSELQSSGLNHWVLEPSGAIVAPFVKPPKSNRVQLVDDWLPQLKTHLADLTFAAADIAQDDAVALEAIRVLAELGGKSVERALEDISANSISRQRRKAAKEALDSVRFQNRYNLLLLRRLKCS